MVLSMIKSIQQFEEKGIENIRKVIGNFVKDPKNHADFIYGITENVIQLGLNMIAETLSDMDNELRESGFRKRKWSIVKKDQTTLLTSLGNVTYEKTLFINKETKERTYLLDQIMGIESHARMTEDTQVRILEEAVETSYRKGGRNASITDHVSKQTVKNKIHNLNFEQLENKKREQKKKVRVLHINADEDHVSAQFWKQKGDLTEDSNKRKNNTLMPKIIYVYEDIIPEIGSKESKRYQLLNVHYFGGLYEGKKNAILWKEVATYIENNYDSEVLEVVYLGGDGASWIKSGLEYIDKSVFVLDRFHKNKYINDSVSHMLDSKSDAWNQIQDCFLWEDKKKLNKIYQELKEYAETESKRETIETARKYLLNNWEGIVIYNTRAEEIKGCSAEGHVSHVYSSRMSSRPLGWSEKGADNMSKLRIYYYNKGDMLELVRTQKQENQQAVGAEEMSASDIFVSDKNKKGMLGKYAELTNCSIPYPQVKKIASIKGHLWGL